MKPFLVVFEKTGARVIKNPDNVSKHLSDGALLNPDLSKVKGVPPQFWKNHNGHLVTNVVKMYDYAIVKKLPLPRLNIFEKLYRWVSRYFQNVIRFK